MSALRLKNTSESEPHIYVVTWAQKKFWGSNGIWAHDLHDTSAMLYQLDYAALLEAGQVWVQFIPLIWREWHDVYMIKIIWVHCG